MRKLGFEETPDYDFLRELLSKALHGEVDDGVYDWMMLNNGKGWEAGTHRDRDRHRDMRASQVPPNAPPAALVRNGSKQGRKSGVPAQMSGEANSRAAQLRADHHQYSNNATGYGGVGQASNVAIHDVPGVTSTTNGTRDHSHQNVLSPSNVNVNSSGGIEGGRRLDDRGPISSGMGNGEGHPAERASFGQKLVRVLTCRCG